MKGKTLLQAKLYFLSECMNEDVGFNANYYGPTSWFSLEHFDGLVCSDVISEIKTDKENQNSHWNLWNKITKHEYNYRVNLTEKNKLWTQATKKENFQRWSIKMLKINSHAVAQDLGKIAAAAQMHFIAAWSQPASEDLIRLAVKESKWNIDKNLEDEIVCFLKYIELI